VKNEFLCPRCKERYYSARYTPNAAPPPALSRTDNRTNVCSVCGAEEALEQAAKVLTPQSRWPIELRGAGPRSC